MNIKGTKVGRTNITSTYTDSVSQSDSVEFTVTAVSLGTISSIDNSVYNGSEIRPLPTITAVVNGNTVELQNGRDYTLEYSNNVNVSTNTVKATVTATGIGNYTGTLSQTWNIVPKVVTLQWGTTSWVYDGDSHSTTCVVSNLVSGDTCTVTLSGNSITNIGSTTVTATGLSNDNYKLPTDSSVNMVIRITAGLFVKLSGIWTPVKKAYKRVEGKWEQQDIKSVFDTSKKYIRKDSI
jgi:hypothetical protein